jgi:transcriptional regulator NrdR family protein
LTVTASTGAISPFSRDKLFLSLYRSCQHRSDALSDASALTNTIIKKLLNQITSGTIPAKTIMQIAQVALNRFDKAASVHYQAFHAQ